MMTKVVLCRGGCCPELSYTDGLALLTGSRAAGEVIVEDDMVGVKLTRDNLQHLVDALARFGLKPSDSEADAGTESNHAKL